MPRGFSLCAHLNADVNPFGLTTNCYYCTVAALKNVDVNVLVSQTQIMQQQTAQHHEITALFSAAGLMAESYVMKGFCTAIAGPSDWCAPWQMDAMLKALLSDGEYCGLGFRRQDGSQHMVVAQRHQGSIICADFQAPAKGRQIQPFPPENGINYVFRAWLFDEIVELTMMMSQLKI